MTPPPLVYNLFPRLVGPATRWPEHAARAAEMGFNWLYLNPWHYPGFSGSLYAVKEYGRLNPLFLPPAPTRRTWGRCATPWSASPRWACAP